MSGSCGTRWRLLVLTLSAALIGSVLGWAVAAPAEGLYPDRGVLAYGEAGFYGSPTNVGLDSSITPSRDGDA